MFANLLTKTVSFLLTVWLTRTLSSDDFGLYSFTITLASWFAIFGGFGVSNALLNVIPERISNNKNASEWVLGGLKLLSVGSLACFLFLFAFSSFLADFVFQKSFASAAIKLAGGFLVLNLIAGFFDYFLVSLKRNDLAFYATVLKEISRVLLIFFFVSSGLSYIGAIYGYMLSFLVFIIFAGYVGITKYGHLFEGKALGCSKVLSSSKWFMAFGISMTILLMSDLLLISILMPIRFTGYYSVVVAIVSALVLLLPIGLITLPLFSEVSSSKESVERRFRKVFYPTVFFTLFISFVLAFFSQALLSLVYPPEYVEHGWLALSILAFMIPAKNIFWLRIQRLIALGRKREQLVFMVVAGLINLFLDCILIPLYGLPGAAFASVFSLVLVSFFVRE